MIYTDSYLWVTKLGANKSHCFKKWLLLFCICIYNLTEYANYHGFSVKARGRRGEGENAIFHNRKFETGFQSLVLPIYSFAHLDQAAWLYQGLRNVFNGLSPSLQFSLELTNILDPTSNLSKVVSVKSKTRPDIALAFKLAELKYHQIWHDMTPLSITQLIASCFSGQIYLVFLNKYNSILG